MSSNSPELLRIESKLDTIVRLLALHIASNDYSLKDRALLLQRAGMTPKEIASLCDTTPNTVSVALSTAKRDGRNKKKKVAKLGSMNGKEKK